MTLRECLRLHLFNARIAIPKQTQNSISEATKIRDVCGSSRLSVVELNTVIGALLERRDGQVQAALQISLVSNIRPRP
jgi:hypothetical protein